MSQVIALKYDVFKYLDKCTETFDLIFADPPYDIKNISDVHKIVFDRGLLANGGILVIEHGRENDLKNLEYFLEHRKYGNVNFSLFSLNHNQQ